MQLLLGIFKYLVLSMILNDWCHQSASVFQICLCLLVSETVGILGFLLSPCQERKKERIF
jgi:hypothetical protein